MISLLKVENLDQIDEETEKCIYLFLDELTRGEGKYKKIIGVDMKIFEEVFYNRVWELKELFEKQRDSENDTNLEAVYERLQSDCMRKFFQLMTVLINNCTDNAKVFKELEIGEGNNRGKFIDLFNILQDDLAKESKRKSDSEEKTKEIMKMLRRITKLAD